MFMNASSQPRVPEIAYHHPELQSTETPTERGTVVHQIRHLVARTLGVAQILWDEAEGSLDHARLTCIEDAAINGRKEPLVRIDDEGIGAFATCQHPMHLRINRGRATIGCIDVQP